MALPLEILSRDFLDRLHPSAVEGSTAVHALMTRLWRDAVELRRGVNRRISRELAWIEGVEADRLRLRTQNFDSARRQQLWLNFFLDERPYFFAAAVLSISENQVETRFPEAVYRAERRDRPRTSKQLEPTLREPQWKVLIDVDERSNIEGWVIDSSAGGFGLDVPADTSVRVGSNVALRFLDGPEGGSTLRGKLCHVSQNGDDRSRVRLGVSLLGASSGLLTVVRPSPERLSWRGAQSAWDVVAAGAVARSEKLLRAVTRRTRRVPRVHLLDFTNEKGEQIRGIADYPGESPVPGAPLILIPPAWGRTKETLLPLAATIVATFARAGRPVSVVRFDGIRKRGESYNDPDCRREGAEHHRFTFSQGVTDIHAVLDNLFADQSFAPSKVVLVTFSAASIDGRRAVAIDQGRRISGWVSVVGSADLQSMMRVVSGGVDYVGGVDRGLSFGIQEILGVEVDMDIAAGDAVRMQLGYLEDACQDMDRVRIPITWIHGRHDAWMDLGRVRTMLSRSDPSNRKLVVVPTGHQLRTSREAFDVFRLIAEEVSKICLGEALRGRLPSLMDLEVRRTAERDRLPRRSVDQRAFWKQYLLGRDGSLGIELMTSSAAYRQFMHEQITELRLPSGGVVADFGSGTGAFLSCVQELPVPSGGLVVHELDYVREAFPRARSVLRSEAATAVRASFIACDLAVDGSRLSIPCNDSTYDAAIASLFITYVPDPSSVLREAYRVLKSGGRLVVSGLRRDADVSKLFIDATEEIARGEGASRLHGNVDVDLEQASRDFLNDAAKLLDLEEDGLFQFRDASELASLLRGAGFSVERTWSAFGDPPQAVVVAARKPL